MSLAFQGFHHHDWYYAHRSSIHTAQASCDIFGSARVIVAGGLLLLIPIIARFPARQRLVAAGQCGLTKARFSMSSLGNLFGTSQYENGIADLSKMYGGLAKNNLPRGMQMLWSIINGTGLTPGMQAQKSMYDSDLLAGYQRALGDTLQGNQARGLSNSLLDMNTRTAMARGYAGDRARYAAGLVGQSEAEKKQMLQLLLSLASGFGGQALGGYQQAASLQSNPMQDIMGAAAMAGQIIGGL